MGPQTEPSQTERLYIEEEELLRDGYRLGVEVFRSGFRPDFIVGLWRGGSTVGLYVQECLQYLGVTTDHIALRTSYEGPRSYAAMVERPQERIRVHGTQYLLENLDAEDRLLIVDDVYSTGYSVQAVIERLSIRLKRNMPHEVRVAVPWTRPAHHRTGRGPDYWLHETDAWLVLPYELEGLSRAEIEEHKPFLLPILEDLAAAGLHPVE